MGVERCETGVKYSGKSALYSRLLSPRLPTIKYLYPMPSLSELDKDDYYFSPEGYVVFTAKYLLKRGYCCQNGCKHCPYGYNKKTGRFDKDKKHTNE
jgi:hypothetical protein